MARGDTVKVGNFADEVASHPEDQWVVGHFIEGGPFKTEALEIKYCHHKKGDGGPARQTTRDASTLILLIRGKRSLTFENRKTFILGRPGDYVFFYPDIPHSWQVLEDGTMFLVIRWPS